jgi:hypothetical protein
MGFRDFGGKPGTLEPNGMHRQLDVTRQGVAIYAFWPDYEHPWRADHVVFWRYGPPGNQPSPSRLRATEALVAAWHGGAPLLPMLDLLYELNPEHREVLADAIRAALEED